MLAWSSIATGLGRVIRAPGLVGCLWLVNLLMVLPAAALVGQAIARSLGASLVEDKLRQGFDMGWYDEYAHSAQGLAKTFRPTVLGAGAVLDNLEMWWSGGLFKQHLGVLVVAVAYALSWTLLSGGLIERFTQITSGERPGGVRSLLVASVRHSPRMLQLVACAALVYASFYGLARWLFPWIERASRDITEEGTVFGYYVAATLVFVLLVTMTNLVFDYARVIAVREGTGFVETLQRTTHFVMRHFVAACSLYYGLGVLTLGLLGLWVLIAPGAGQSNVLGLVWSIVVGQLYFCARLSLRLSFWAAETELCQRLMLGSKVRQGDPTQRTDSAQSSEQDLAVVSG